MRNCISASNKPCTALLVALLWLCVSCRAEAPLPFADYASYCILAATDSKANAHWAAYLATQLRKRTREATKGGQNVVTEIKDEAHNPALYIYMVCDAKAEQAVKAERDGNSLTLTARDDKAMLWLVYQFISAAGAEDQRIDCEDLPPALLHFTEKEETLTPAFSYRSIYSPANADPEMLPIRGTHHVDNDWGLWGHHLASVFTEGPAPAEAHALVDGKRANNQWCLSSEALYKAYEAFVIDQWGPGTAAQSIRFAVMPDDNRSACQCPKCRALGCTATNATPAAAQLAARLAKRFPHHQFFLAAYGSTATAPKEPLPANVGALLSALDVPMKWGVFEEKAGKDFDAKAQSWLRAVPTAYVWDYMRNFDDYLTPYPCLRIMQQRLHHWSALGIKGVFLNGSGYDYASFDDVETAVLSALLIQPDADLSRLIRSAFARLYPVCGAMMAQWYMGAMREVKGTLPTYGGIAQRVAAGFDKAKYADFIAKLDRLSKKTDAAERKRLNQLLTAQAFTQLELMRLAPNPSAEKGTPADRMALLSAHTAFKNMANYREAYGLIDDYLAQWRLQKPVETVPFELKALSELDADYPSLACLTNGRHAFATDYHTGWLLYSGKELRLQIAMKTAKTSKITFCCLVAPCWRIAVPQRAELWQHDRKVAERDLSSADEPFTTATFTLPTTAIDATQPFELRLIRRESARGSLALDEITIE